MESQNFDFTSILKIVRENLKIFIAVGIVVTALAAIFSGPSFIKPRFKSVAVVYPLNINLYSEESQTEQMLQMFEASNIRDSLIEKFDLYKRYEIEKDQASSKFYLYQEYNDRVVTSKTKYESILLEVYDEDPVIAKEMADEVLTQLNSTIRSFRNRRGLNKSESFREQMDYQLQLIDSLEQRIRDLSKEKRLLSYEAQSRELVKGYIEELSRNKNSDATKELREWLEDLEESGSLHQTLQNVTNYAAQQYGILAMKFLDWRTVAYENINYLDVVVKPEVADKKSWPVRWVIVVTSVIGALLLTLIILSIIRYGK